MPSSRHSHSSRTPSIATIHEALSDVFTSFVDQRYLPVADQLKALSSKEVRVLHAKGFDGKPFKDALTTFFSSSELSDVPSVSQPMPNVVEYNLMDAGSNYKDLMRCSLIQDVTNIADRFNAEDLGNFLIQCAGFPALFPKFALRDLRDFKGRLQDVIDLGKLDIEWRDYCSKYQSCLGMAEDGARASTIEALKELRNERGDLIFNIAWEFRNFVGRGGGPAEALELLSLENSAGERLFQTAEEITEAQHFRSKKTLDFIECMNAQDDRGEPVFRYGYEINDFLRERGNAETAIALANLNDSKGERAFNGYEVMLLQEAKIPLKECELWARNDCDAVEQVYRQRLGLTSVNYSNDGRPKCLLLVPTDDTHSDLGARAFLDATQPLYRTLTNAYDICIRAMRDTPQTYDTIKQYGPESTLTVISGHGNTNTVAVARERGRYGRPNSPEDVMITNGDYRLLSAVSELKPNTVLFLDSCGTATGGIDANHLASFIGKHVPHVALIASREGFSPKDVIIDTVYPLRLKIFGSLGNETTYSAWDGVEAAPDRERHDVTRDVYKTALPLTLIRRDYIFGPLKNSPNQKAFHTVCKKVGNASYPLADVPEMQKAADEITSVRGVSIIEKRDLFADFDQEDWQYLFGERLKQNWCAAYSSSYGSDSSCLKVDILGFLSSKGFYPTKSPENGDIAVYLSQLSKNSASDEHPLEQVTPILFGEYNDGAIISKPYLMHVIRHPLEIFPTRDKKGELPVYVVYFRGESK